MFCILGAGVLGLIVLGNSVMDGGIHLICVLGSTLFIIPASHIGKFERSYFYSPSPISFRDIVLILIPTSLVLLLALHTSSTTSFTRRCLAEMALGKSE